MTHALPALETEIRFEICIFVLDEKAISKYRPVATISKIEIVTHFPVVLVGECLPQTLLFVLNRLHLFDLCSVRPLPSAA